MTREGASLSVDSTQLVSSLFALLPIPVAIIDDNDGIVIANSFFKEIFPDSKTLRGAQTNEILVPGRGVFDLEILPLNDQGFRIVYGVDVSREVSLRRQLTQLERRSGRSAGATRERVPCDLNELIRSVAAAREPYTKAARIAVSMELSPNLAHVKGDPEDIEKVLIGLLTNAEQAILFAQRRFGAIHIKTWAESGYLRLSICDNGCGIGTRDIFSSSLDPFLRDGSQARPIGIGLCAEIVKDHGGELFCWSSYDAGSTYTMELPTTVAPVDFQSTALQPGESRRLAGRSILVIDDDVHVTELVFDVLLRHGAKVDLAESNSQALPFLQSKHYDLIICDQNIPGLSGDRFRTVVESLAPGVFQRFLFVTPEAVSGQTRRFFAQAGVEFIRRPFHIDDLMSTIEMVLRQNQPQRS